MTAVLAQRAQTYETPTAMARRRKAGTQWSGQFMPSSSQGPSRFVEVSDDIVRDAIMLVEQNMMRIDTAWNDEAICRLVQDNDYADRSENIIDVHVPINSFARSLRAKLKYALPGGLEERLSFLQECAVEERTIWSEASKDQFVAFMRSQTAVRPALGLDDNGDIKALWRRDSGEQILLRFTGVDAIGAVLIGAKRDGTRRQEALRASVRAVSTLIDELGLRNLLRR